MIDMEAMERRWDDVRHGRWQFIVDELIEHGLDDIDALVKEVERLQGIIGQLLGQPTCDWCLEDGCPGVLNMDTCDCGCHRDRDALEAKAKGEKL